MSEKRESSYRGLGCDGIAPNRGTPRILGGDINLGCPHCRHIEKYCPICNSKKIIISYCPQCGEFGDANNWRTQIVSKIESHEISGTEIPEKIFEMFEEDPQLLVKKLILPKEIVDLLVAKKEGDKFFFYIIEPTGSI